MDLTSSYAFKTHSGMEMPSEIVTLFDRIQDAAYEVRTSLAPGYLEQVYQNALEHEFKLRGIKADREAPIKIPYKDCCVGEYRADFFVENKIIIELNHNRIKGSI